MKNKILSIALILAIAVSVVGIAVAYSGVNESVVIENVENLYLEPKAADNMGMFGGNTNFDSIVLDNDLTVGDDLTVGGGYGCNWFSCR
jgi:hypothetical protein